MKVSFACPSCGARGSVDAAAAGRQARCPSCRDRFTIPEVGAAAEDVYSLDATVVEAPVDLPLVENHAGTTFVPSRGDDPSRDAPPRASRRQATETAGRSSRDRQRNAARRTHLVRAGVVALVVLGAVALLAPHGTAIAGGVLLVAGTLMVLLGFLAGAYGAFSEDFIHGVLYMVVPLYTAYYLLTRWDDLWAWFACATAGVALVLLGTELLRWGGMSF